MPQAVLPLIPDGATAINKVVSVVRSNGTCAYFVGVAPVFRHAAEDTDSFRVFTSQLIAQKACSHADIVRAFRVAPSGVKRNVARFREGGNSVFFQPRAVRGATVMTDDVTRQAQELLDRGRSRREVATTLGIKPDERVMAAVGALQGAPTRFESCRDVAFGGVLCALPALAESEVAAPRLGRAARFSSSNDRSIKACSRRSKRTSCRVCFATFRDSRPSRNSSTIRTGTASRGEQIHASGA